MVKTVQLCEVKLHQLGLEAHAASLNALSLHVWSGQLPLDALLQFLAQGGGDKDWGISGPVPGVRGHELLFPPLHGLVATFRLESRLTY